MKTINIICGILSIVFLANFLTTSNKALVTPDISTGVNFENLKVSNATNLDFINEIFDSKNADFSSKGYYPQIYSDSLQATYYALFILDSIGKLSEINQGEVITYVMSHYNSSSHQFEDSSAKRYLSSTIPGLYMPLTTLLEVNCYAVLSLEILSSLHLIDTAETIDFIWECYHPILHGFIGQPYDVSLDEGFKIPTADNTYYAVITLELLISNWNSYSQERSDIVSYIAGLQSVGTHVGFYNDNDPLFDSLLEMEPNQFSSFYAIKILETFGSSHVDSIDKIRFHQDLTDLYHPEDFYFDISSVTSAADYANLVATAINLELSDITGFTGINRTEVISFIISNRNILGGWDASTTVKYHELIDIFQIIRSLVNTGALSELIPSDKNEIASYLNLFSQLNGFSLISEDYTSVELIHTVISSFDYFDRVGDLEIQALFNLLDGCALYMGGPYEFFACTKLESSIAGFRSKPLDYYTLGYDKYVEEINAMYSHRETYMILNSLKKIFKLNDFALTHDLNSVLQDVIASQFMDPEYQENYGAFLYDNVASSSEWKNKLVYLQYSFYAIKVIELIADYLGLGPITNLGFSELALANYILGNIIESPTEIYYDIMGSGSTEIALENLYYAIYSLKAINGYGLDSNKIKNFALNHLDYSNVKNLYYCYKISEILNLSIDFDAEQSHTLIQSIYSDTHREFFESTERNRLEQEALAWICEMAKNDNATIYARYSNTIQLGGSNLISVELWNLILSNFGQHEIIKLESEQLGTILLDKMANNTHQKEINVSIDPANYPLIEGELCVYDGEVKVDQFPISFETTVDSIYNYSIIKTKSQIEINVTASLIFASGEHPLYDGDVRTDVYVNDTYFKTISFASKNGSKSTNFTFSYQPNDFGNYSFEIYMDDPYHSSSQFLFQTTFDYFNITDDESPSDPDSENDPENDPIQTFGNDATLTIPLAIFILTVGSGGYVISIKNTNKKAKRKPNKLKTK